jgi:foldase protein PrsA
MKAALHAVPILAALYLIADLFVIHGPVHRRLHPRPENLAALVGDIEITRSQVERALTEQLWLEGKSITTLASAELAIARKAALDGIIDHELLRIQVAADSPAIIVSESEIDERLRRLVGRFETKGALESAMKTQGIPTEANLRARIAANIQQEKWLTRRISPTIQVTEQETQNWFEENQAALSQPIRIKARHIFIPTLDHPPEEAKQKLDKALSALMEKRQDFATLAKEWSEDPATKDLGGELGWMTADRIPADFAAPVFSLSTNQPALIRTKLGWHLVEVTARKAAEARTFEQAKPEILAALQVIKARQATLDIKNSLRQSSASRIKLFE